MFLFGSYERIFANLLYCLSRTVGLPQIPAEPEAWFEPLGVISLLAEGLFVLVLFKDRQGPLFKKDR
ncbi:MAG: hypothetical protein MUC39_03225 [Candidatus Omnitrophica bacterium]|jgi:hypothetical protein|nr:hypothetical protein [Candidatus Omnitrophota bacterium]